MFSNFTFTATGKTSASKTERILKRRRRRLSRTPNMDDEFRRVVRHVAFRDEN